MSIGIPIMLLHEALPHTVTVETRSGDTYRGRLIAAEDCMNVQLKDVSLTRRDGRVAALSHVFIRGSKIRFVIVPDVLASAPMFKPAKGGATGLAWQVVAPFAAACRHFGWELVSWSLVSVYAHPSLAFVVPANVGFVVLSLGGGVGVLMMICWGSTPFAFSDVASPPLPSRR